ncbi:type 1 fimbrial protein [Serratia sp. arafor3]|uniref:Type 1 fimbrial protein n=2 Tax=Serratia silvae TaxID=2824122 RepID=A0ABT0KI29_9GAMM|nr:type 1 fimbrial protein [Serratia silvae]
MKTIFKATALCLALGGIGINSSALANSVQLNITGTVKASPCVVESNNGKIDVPLGDIEAASMATAGSASGWEPFAMKLVNCPVSTTKVTATFSGTQADENVDMYKNTGDAGSIQIELVDDSETLKLGNGKTMDAPVNANEAVFNLKARAFSLAGGVTPGSISGAVQVAFVYH